jgi:hypothetical protein
LLCVLSRQRSLQCLCCRTQNVTWEMDNLTRLKEGHPTCERNMHGLVGTWPAKPIMLTLATTHSSYSSFLLPSATISGPHSLAVHHGNPVPALIWALISGHCACPLSSSPPALLISQGQIILGDNCRLWSCAELELKPQFSLCVGISSVRSPWDCHIKCSAQISESLTADTVITAVIYHHC